MYAYRLISEIEGVPEMADLVAASIERPPSTGAVFRISFSTGYGPGELARYEPAVGARCRVTRSSHAGCDACEGAVVRVSPCVEVTLDGEGWQPA
jgi:hypothetical protein